MLSSFLGDLEGSAYQGLPPLDLQHGARAKKRARQMTWSIGHGSNSAA